MKNNSVVGEYAGRLKAASAQALQSAGMHEYRLDLFGRIISLQFAGQALIPAVLPALRHLLVRTDIPPSLTITLWDSTSTGVALPGMPWHPPAGEAWKVDGDEISAFYLPARACLTWFNRQENQAFYWLPDASEAEIVETCYPILYLWAWWSEKLPAQLLHAAAVGGTRSAALLVGRGGSGKSTTALLTLQSPLRYLADDYCLVSMQPEPAVQSLFSSAKLLLPDRPRFPWLEPAYFGRSDEKALYILYPQLADRLACRMPLRALVVPTITGEDSTRLVPARPMEILRALAPSTLLQLHVGIDPAGALSFLSELARKLPCYRLLLGTDFERIPAVLSGLLED